jgi:ABC-type transporter Mla subunit MlaD
MSDRNLGYFVILFFMAFIAGVTFYLLRQALAPVYFRTIIFNSANSLSFLKKQDPVRFRGTETGKIRSIYLKEGKTCVRIETREPLDIYQDYQIIADAKGLMGDRYIEIHPGDIRGHLLAQDEPLTGIFPLGPVEAIAYTAELKAKIHSLTILTDEFRKDAPRENSTAKRFDVMINKMDSITVSFTKLLNKAQSYTTTSADTLAATLRKANEVTKNMNASASAAVHVLEKVSVKTRRLLNIADSLAIFCESFLERLNAIEAGSLMNDISKLRPQIKSLRNFLNEMQENGLHIPASL